MNKLFVLMMLWMMSCLPTLAQAPMDGGVWNSKHLSDSRHLWVPISWEKGTPVLKNNKKYGRSACF